MIVAIVLVLKLFVVFAILVYAGVVLTEYAIDREYYQPRLDIWHPVGSALQMFLWAGVKILHLFLVLGRLLLDQLFAASADVATWTVERCAPELQRKVHERFL
jgi:hypothetical protein